MERKLRAAGFRVITIDLLGFGTAQKPSDSSYDYDSHVEHVRKILSNYPFDQPFIIMGHSMGALIAARYAKLYPTDISRAVLLHPPLYASREEAQKTLRNTSLFYRFLLDSRFRGFAWGILRNIAFSGIAPHTKQSREQSLTNIIESAELFDDLAAISAPTLLLNGTKDRPIYKNNVRHIPAQSAVQIMQLPVAHHSPVFRTKLTATKIVQFLRAA